MKMAKASTADLEAADAVVAALESISRHWDPCMPDPIAQPLGNRDFELFDAEDPDQCRRVVEHLIELTRSASLARVVHGMAVLLDPRNRVVDPDADTLEIHPARRTIAERSGEPAP